MTFQKKGAAGITIRKVIYAMSVSLDGFIEVTDGSTAINALELNGSRLPNNTR
jgi:hypothetical protein